MAIYLDPENYGLDEEAFLPCEFCDWLGPADSYIEHATAFHSDEMYNEPHPSTPEREPSPVQVTVQKTEEVKQLQPVKEKKKTNVLVPCIYCDTTIPVEEVDDHEELCGLHTNKCPDCGMAVAAKDQGMHHHFCIQQRTKLSEVSEEKKQKRGGMQINLDDFNYVSEQSAQFSGQFTSEPKTMKNRPDTGLYNYNTEEANADVEYEISDDDDDSPETIESFLKRASIILRQRKQGIESQKKDAWKL